MMYGETIKESPLFWPAKIKGSTLHVLDETQLPNKQEYIKVNNTKEAVKVIKDMKTRAFGQLLVVLNTFILEMKAHTGRDKTLLKKLTKTADALCASRPTFPFGEVTQMVLGWANAALAQKEAMIPYVTQRITGYLEGIRDKRMERVYKIADVIRDGDNILTHCNVSGELAMATFIARQDGKTVQVFATETRPYFQGAKLTAWELKKLGTQVTLIADNAIGTVMADALVNKVIVGSDRSCANGDFANKIGTYQIAVLAKEFHIPFYVMTQPSNEIPTGKDIPIEIRPEEELLKYEKKSHVRKGVKGFYPAFDVVPHQLITQPIAIDVRSHE